jgi:transposase-like protein
MLELITAKTDEAETRLGEATLDELARVGAQRMIATALQLEVNEYLARYRGERDAAGHALVVRNGRARPRPVLTGVGPVTITAPRVNDRRVVAGRRQKFTSAILPPWVRRSPRVESVLPLLYLHGLSSGDFREALPALLGPEAAGLSPSAIGRLTRAWTAEYEAFRRRELADRDYIYLWADGIHFTIRLEEERLCTLVLIGVRPDGTKEVVALEDGYRESAESWRTVLRDLKRRGLRAPVLAIGDGALGFWAAVREVWPETGEQRCWVHRMANVLDKLPKSLQPRAKQALHEMMYADTRAAAEQDIARFVQEYRAKYPKAVASLTVDQDRLLAHFDFPAEHWKHVRTTDESVNWFLGARRSRLRVGTGDPDRRAGPEAASLAAQGARWRISGAPPWWHPCSALTPGAGAASARRALDTPPRLGRRSPVRGPGALSRCRCASVPADRGATAGPRAAPASGAFARSGRGAPTRSPSSWSGDTRPGRRACARQPRPRICSPRRLRTLRKKACGKPLGKMTSP